LNCCNNSHIAGATPKIAAEFLSNLTLSGVGKAQHQVPIYDQRRWRAKAALQPVVLAEGGAQASTLPRHHRNLRWCEPSQPFNETAKMVLRVCS
jgi:hypothetical protein